MNLSESALLREVRELEQELVALKAPQRYGMGQVKTYVSNRVTAYSRVIEAMGGYERRVLRGYLSFRNDKPGKRVIPTLLFQLYNSSGTPIRYQTSMLGDQNPSITVLQSLPDTGSGETLLIVEFQTSGQAGQTDAFYAEFWVVSNDSGVLTYEGDCDGTY